MRVKIVLSTSAVVAALALTATACNGGSSGSSSSVKMGLSLSTLNNPYFVQLKAGAQAEAKKDGVSLTVTDAQNDASQQANQVQNFTSSNLGAIIINPVDSDASAPSVKVADKAGIPVVAADRGVNGATVATTVASDNVTGGKLAAKELATLLGGKGSVVVLQGTAGTSAANQRFQGFSEGIAAFPGIKVVAKQDAGFDRTKGLDVMTNLLQAHSDVSGVFAANDEMGLGAIKALGSKAGASVKVVSFDGEPDGLAAVKNGTLSATVAQQPSLIGKLAVQNALNASKKKKVTSVVNVPVKVVTKQNVASLS